jgi:hypothetical protein
MLSADARENSPEYKRHVPEGRFVKMLLFFGFNALKLTLGIVSIKLIAFLVISTKPPNNT